MKCATVRERSGKRFGNRQCADRLLSGAKAFRDDQILNAVPFCSQLLGVPVPFAVKDIDCGPRML